MGDVWWEPLAAWTANTTASPRATAQPGLSGSCAAGFNLPAGMPLEVAVGRHSDAPPPPLSGVSMGITSGCHHNDRLADGYIWRLLATPPEHAVPPPWPPPYCCDQLLLLPPARRRFGWGAGSTGGWCVSNMQPTHSAPHALMECERMFACLAPPARYNIFLTFFDCTPQEPLMLDGRDSSSRWEAVTAGPGDEAPAVIISGGVAVVGWVDAGPGGLLAAPLPTELLGKCPRQLYVGGIRAARTSCRLNASEAGLDGNGSDRGFRCAAAPGWLCVVRDANMGHQLAGGSSSWCPELESRTTHMATSCWRGTAHGTRWESVALLRRPS